MAKRLGLAALLILIATGWAAAERQVYVQSDRAKLMAAPNFASEVVAVATKGELLVVVEESPRWVRVEAGAAAGWIPTLLVGDHPPLQRATQQGDHAEQAQQGARRRASVATSAGATRGLTTERARQRSGGSPSADHQALEQVESLNLPEEEVRAFLKPLEKP